MKSPSFNWLAIFFTLLFVLMPGKNLVGQEKQNEEGQRDQSRNQQDETKVAGGESGPDAVSADDGQFESLFDGKSLEGWINPYEWGEVEVADGEIHLTADKKFFLVTERVWSDFVLEAEICLPPEGKANSGLMFRCHVEPNRVFGYQAECDPGERAWTGGLYDEGRRAWLFPEKGSEGKTKLVQAPMGEWIRYRVICQGDHIRIFINDELTTDFHDDVDAVGHIGIQHHGEKNQTYRFRNIRIKDLTAEETKATETPSKPDAAKKPNEKGGDGQQWQ